jgi:hypothetical protein
MIENNTNYRQQVEVLKKEKEEVEQQCDLALKEVQTTQEQNKHGIRSRTIESERLHAECT